jgi:hypothetical protein
MGDLLEAGPGGDPMSPRKGYVKPTSEDAQHHPHVLLRHRPGQYPPLAGSRPALLQSGSLGGWQPQRPFTRARNLPPERCANTASLGGNAAVLRRNCTGVVMVFPLQSRAFGYVPLQAFPRSFRFVVPGPTGLPPRPSGFCPLCKGDTANARLRAGRWCFLPCSRARCVGQALVAVCSAHGLDDAVGVLDGWLDSHD